MYKALNEANSSKASDTLDQIYGIAKGTINVATGFAKAKDDYSYSSITQAASKMVAVFPVLASRTVSAETAHMITKYIEQYMCNMFTLALQQANISTAKSGIEYLRKYHQNLDIGGDNANAIISTMNTWIDAYERGKSFHESTSFSSVMYDQLNESDDIDIDHMLEFGVDIDVPAEDVAEIMKIMQEQEKIVVYDTKLNPVSINDYIVNEFANGNYHVSIKPASSYMNEAGGGLRSDGRIHVNTGAKSRDEALQDQMDSDADDEYAYRNKKRRWEEDDRAAAQARDTAREKERQREAQRKRDREDYDRAQAKRDRAEARSDRNTARNERRNDRQRAAKERKDQENSRRTSGNNVFLKDMDVKKMNDANPSLLVVRFYVKEESNGSISSTPTEFIIGVKSKLIPVSTTEILRRIMNDNKDGKKFMKLMRLMSGELSLGNVLFGLSRMKDDVKSTKRKGAHGDIWNLLANRAEAANQAVKHGVHNDFSAITTVVISQNDADELFREENLDITDPSNARHFMQSYNLIGFVITDDATESIKIMFDDGEKYFKEYAYRMFERETKDGTYKKLINLMAASK